MGVCSIRWEKQLQNFVYQWPAGRTKERESQSSQVRLPFWILRMITIYGLGEFDGLECNKIIFEQDTV